MRYFGGWRIQSVPRGSICVPIRAIDNCCADQFSAPAMLSLGVFLFQLQINIFQSFFKREHWLPAGVSSFLDREDRIWKIERGPFFAGDDRLLPGNPLQNFEELIDRGSHAGAQIIYAGEVVRYHLGKECTDVVDMNVIADDRAVAANDDGLIGAEAFHKNVHDSLRATT